MRISTIWKLQRHLATSYHITQNSWGCWWHHGSKRKIPIIALLMSSMLLTKNWRMCYGVCHPRRMTRKIEENDIEMDLMKPAKKRKMQAKLSFEKKRWEDLAKQLDGHGWTHNHDVPEADIATAWDRYSYKYKIHMDQILYIFYRVNLPASLSLCQGKLHRQPARDSRLGYFHCFKMPAACTRWTNFLNRSICSLV